MNGYKKCKKCGRFSRDKICPKCGKKHGWLDTIVYINDKRDFIDSRCPKCGDRYTKSPGSMYVICINPKCGFSKFWSKPKPVKQVQPKKPNKPTTAELAAQNAKKNNSTGLRKPIPPREVNVPPRMWGASAINSKYQADLIKYQTELIEYNRRKAEIDEENRRKAELDNNSLDDEIKRLEDELKRKKIDELKKLLEEVE